MNNKKTRFIAALAVLAVAFAGLAAVMSSDESDATTSYYVNYADGNDGNAGTSSGNAFKTFNKAITTASVGDTILFVGDYDTTADGAGINLSGKGVTLTSAGPNNSTISGVIRLSTDSWNTADQPLSGTFAFVNLGLNLTSMIGWEGTMDSGGADRSTAVNNVTFQFSGCDFTTSCYDSTIRMVDVGKVTLNVSGCTFTYGGSDDNRAIAISSKNEDSGSTATITDTVFTNYPRSVYVTNFASLTVSGGDVTPHATQKAGKASFQAAGPVENLIVSIKDVDLNNNPANKPFYTIHDSCSGGSIKSFEVEGDVYTDDGADMVFSIVENGTFTVPEGTTFYMDAFNTGWILINEGTITNNGTITNKGTIVNAGTITNNGTISITGDNRTDALVIDGASAKITGAAPVGGVYKGMITTTLTSKPSITMNAGTIENQEINLGVVGDYGIIMTSVDGDTVLKDNNIVTRGCRFIDVPMDGKNTATISGNAFVQADQNTPIKSVILVGKGEATAWTPGAVVKATGNDFSKVTVYRTTHGAGGGHEAGAPAYDSKPIRILSADIKIGLEGSKADLIVDNGVSIGMVSGTTSVDSNVQIVSTMTIAELGIMDGQVTVPVDVALTVNVLQIGGPYINKGTTIITKAAEITDYSYPEDDQKDKGSISNEETGTIYVQGAMTNNSTVASTNGGDIFVSGSYSGTGEISGYPLWYQVILKATPSNGGTFEIEGAPYDQLFPYYPAGEVEIVASPVEGFAFKEWEDSPTSEASRYVTIDSVKTFTATFETAAKTCSVYFKSTDGLELLETQEVEKGKLVNYTEPAPEAGKRFVGWFYEKNVLDPVDKAMFDFSVPVTEDVTVYAGWATKATVSLPIDDCYVIKVDDVVQDRSMKDVPIDTVFTLDIEAEPTYHLDRVIVDGFVEDVPCSVTVTGNVSVCVIVTEDGTNSQQTKAGQVIENADGSVTETSVTISADTVTNEATIHEQATTDGNTVITTAKVTADGVDVRSGTREDMVITATMSDAIKAAAEATGADDLSVSIETNAGKVTMPKDLIHDENVKDVTVNLAGASITLPKNAIAEADMADSISLSVEASAATVPAAALGNSQATAAFDLNLEGTNTTQFAAGTKATVTVEVDLPAGAINVRFYCIDEPTTVPATVAGNTATAALPHFSAWAIVYDMPADAADDGDELPPSWHYVPQQQARSSQTTMIVAACAAAVAAIAVALVMINFMRKS